MTLLMILRVSLKALVRNKMRTFLTMLGIIIGVATVITMLAIGTGARASVEANIASLGTNVLFVSAGSSKSGGVRGGGASNSNFTVDDVMAIEKECPAVRAVAPMTRDGVQAVYGDQNWQTSVVGTGPGYPMVRNWKVVVGRFFGDDDVRAASKVCVLGQDVVKELFGGDDPIGQTIRIKHIPFRVIGILDEKGESSYGGSQDDVIVVPYTTVLKRITRNDNIRWSMISARSAEETDEAKDQITALLRQRHRLTPDDDDDFTIRSQAEFAKAADESGKIFQLLLGGIASVSLLVGGIGIMNIMLVSVTERIREIGIRMALGARGRDILMQFLVEAVMLSLVGGLIGIMLGYSLALLASGYSEWPLMVSPDSVAMSFGFAAVVGIFFGLYPAVKASRLDPIQALRHE
ncbi:MAG: FtsX-like permease family protein [Acidobacteria bacterium]|nr:FtsX-like permease family protein [Acidobacteriota bacterium]